MILMPDEKIPRVVVGCLLINGSVEILLTRAKNWGGKWVCPGGHLEYGESIEDAVRREVKEETNLDLRDIRLVCVQDALFPEDYRHRNHMVFIDYCGTAINPDGVVLNHELQEFRWLLPEDALGHELNDSTRRFIGELIRMRRG
jgi:nucleoside triphosphatase